VLLRCSGRLFCDVHTQTSPRSLSSFFFAQEAKDLIRKLLVVDPSERLAARDALQVSESLGGWVADWLVERLNGWMDGWMDDCSVLSVCVGGGRALADFLLSRARSLPLSPSLCGPVSRRSRLLLSVNTRHTDTHRTQ
jgi:serine/threonine protein kinase